MQAPDRDSALSRGFTARPEVDPATGDLHAIAYNLRFSSLRDVGALTGRAHRYGWFAGFLSKPVYIAVTSVAGSQDPLVESRQSPGVFGHQLLLGRLLTVPRNYHRHRVGVGQHGLRRSAIVAVARAAARWIVFLVTQALTHCRTEASHSRRGSQAPQLSPSQRFRVTRRRRPGSSKQIVTGGWR